MTHGSPDWGQFDPLRTIYRVTDLGELAARLNVTHSFSRSGTVIWWDDFEDNINKWEISAVGNGAAADLSTDKARSGGKSAILTVGDQADDSTYIARYMGIPPADTPVGYEVSFIVNISIQFMVYLYVYSSNYVYLAGIRTDWGNNKIEYYNASSAWADLLTSFPLSSSPIWTTWKLVIDFSGAGEYKTLIQNNESYDITGHYCRKDATSNADSTYIFLAAKNLAANNRSMYVDDFIMTYNEP